MQPKAAYILRLKTGRTQPLPYELRAWRRRSTLSREQLSPVTLMSRATPQFYPKETRLESEDVGQKSRSGRPLVGLVAETPALADELNLPPKSVDLVVPPFVHAHEHDRSRVVECCQRGRNDSLDRKPTSLLILP
jgi:hypothetical protein